LFEAVADAFALRYEAVELPQVERHLHGEDFPGKQLLRGGWTREGRGGEADTYEGERRERWESVGEGESLR